MLHLAINGDKRRAPLISMLQVSDAAAEPSEDVWEELTSGRLLPGSGAIDLANNSLLGLAPIPRP